MEENNYEYLPHDEYVVFHDRDNTKKTMVFSLPDPPPLDAIDGYGKAPEDQRFSRVKMPPRLKYLERQAVEQLKEEAGSRGAALTPFKIQRRFWDLLYEQKDKYRSEIKFIKRMWWHRLHGYWCFIKGKPTWIPPWHFFYLNFWYMPTVKPDNYPDYRDRDRKEYVAMHYTLTTHETFANLDDDGFAIPEKDGSYKMIEMPDRTCLGGVQNKNRRSGNTNKGLCACAEKAMRSKGGDGMGIMSYTENNAGSHFTGKMVPAFFNMPIWYRPFTTSKKDSQKEIKLQVPGGEFDYEGSETNIDYAETADPKFYDGQYLVSALLDESGKTTTTSVSRRWQIVAECLRLGSKIHGWSYHPSTVDEMTAGGADYYFLVKSSDFYQRVKGTGLTFSGLINWFVPADEGHEGFIDSYGHSVMGDEPTESQKAEGFKTTATQKFLATRDALINKGDPESMDAYRMEKRLYPLQSDDSWNSGGGNIGWDIESMEKRLAEHRKKKPYRTGYLRWKNDVKFTEVEWVDDPNGRMMLGLKPLEACENKWRRAEERTYNTFIDDYEYAKRPLFRDKYVMGVDPIGWDNKETQKKRAKTKGSGKKSDFAFAVLWNYDADVDDGKDVVDWESELFVFAYKHRPRNPDVANEDALMAAIYYGAMVYPETNKENTWEYFIKNGYAGYLLYDRDPVTGKLKEKPGQHTIDKTVMFSLFNKYATARIHKELFTPLLQEATSINSVDELTINDLLTAYMLALKGAKSTYVNMLKKAEDRTVDLGGVIKSFWVK